MNQIFEISIRSWENFSWQGTLKTKDGAFPFQSELELLLEMERLLEREGTQANPLLGERHTGSLSPSRC